MARVRSQTNDGLEMPAFLKRGTPAHAAFVKKAEQLAAEGRGFVMVAAEDRDAPIHALAAELGFKRHSYRVEWFRDETWLKVQMEEKAKRDAVASEKKAERDAAKAKAKAERDLLGSGNKVKKERGPSRKRKDLPQGRIQWIGPNPKKTGTDAHARWEKLSTYHGKSVESYLFDKCNPTTLANALKAGKVKVLSDDEISKAGPAAQQPPADAAGGAKRAGAEDKKGAATGKGAGPARPARGTAAGKPAKPAGKQKGSKPGSAGKRPGMGRKVAKKGKKR